MAAPVQQGATLSPIARALRAYLRSGLRGGTRLAFTLGRWLPSLHHVPVVIGTTVVHVDLRDDTSHGLLKGSPWPDAPWEEDEQGVMRHVLRPGDVAFDVGAHFGLHTVLLAQLVRPDGSVHVFEPNPRRHEALAYVASVSGATITLHRFGLSDHNGDATLFIPHGDESMSSMSDWTEGRVGAIEPVRCEFHRLDDVMTAEGLPRPDFIKCDVEGAERRVFEGARAILDRVDAPCVLYEANTLCARGFGDTVSAATEWLSALSQPAYRFFHVQPGATLVPVPPQLHTRDLAFNLLAVPASRVERLEQRNGTTPVVAAVP
jgi:FkbM family methyltransferase